SAAEIPSLLSIVQELVSNALDASAAKITVSLSGGGLDSISVTDNGYGIPQDSFSLLAKHGCTSKPSCLFARGNSLASICAVSKQVRIHTMTSDDEVATMLSFDTRGALVNKRAVAGNIGTAVTVLQPLSVVPVRYKFAKSQLAKIGRDIHDWLVRCWMANHHISMSLSSGMAGSSGSRLTMSASLNLKEAAEAYLGSKCSGDCIFFEHQWSRGELKGATTAGVVARKGAVVDAKRLSPLSVSINGIPCSSSLLPNIRTTLAGNRMDSGTIATKKRFIGFLSFGIPAYILDRSSHTPLFVSSAIVEEIEAEVAALVLRAGEEKVVIVKNKLKLPVNNNHAGGMSQSVSVPQLRSFKRTSIHPLNPHTQDIVPVSLSIPKLFWSLSSPIIDDAVNSAAPARVICWLMADGRIVAPGPSCQPMADVDDKAHLCLLWVNDAVIALDTNALPLKAAPDPRSLVIEISPPLRPYLCAAKI
ncbi:hypothetical protein FBU59_004866, partial [Linderina macrospora]